MKSMQLSNGMTPLGLHLGHLLAELPLILLTTTVITIIFAAASSQFLALGYLVSRFFYANKTYAHKIPVAYHDALLHCGYFVFVYRILILYEAPQK